MSFDWSYHHRAENAIAHGYLTNSKSPRTLGFGAYPTHIRKAHMCYLTDTSGKRYVDYICGLGTNLIGYGHVKIADAIAEGYRRGGCPSLATDLEVEVAEELKSVFPFVDKWRFLKSGSEACSAAIRIARSYTGEDLVASEGYHGWHDEFTSLTPPADGVPNVEYPIIKQDSGMPKAARIIEPVITDHSRERYRVLKDYDEAAKKYKHVLIHDEVITGFRWKKWSVSRDSGVDPDMICIGKAMAGGLPLAAVGGRKDIMESDYFVSSTYAGDTVSLMACKKMIELLKKSYDINMLWREGQYFLDQFNSLWDEIQIEGYSVRGRFVGKPHILDLFFQNCVAAGVIFGPSWFFNFPLIGETQRTLEVCNDVVRRIKLGEARLYGEPRRSPFSDKARARTKS